MFQPMGGVDHQFIELPYKIGVQIFLPAYGDGALDDGFGARWLDDIESFAGFEESDSSDDFKPAGQHSDEFFVQSINLGTIGFEFRRKGLSHGIKNAF